MAYSYEAEQKILRRLFDEVQSDVAEDIDCSLDDDHLEIQNESTDSEQDMSDDDVATADDDVATVLADRGQIRAPCMVGSDGTRWKKHFNLRKNVRTRADNLITQLPGVKGEAKQKKTTMEIWSLFFTNTMLEKIVFYTNR